MRLLTSILTVCALVASVLSEPKKTECVTPDIVSGPNCRQITLKYFYNTTSEMCEHFRWNGCGTKGLFESRYKCVSTCNEKQGAPFCANPPPSPCEDEKDKKGRKRYYYNITTKTCEEYNFCGGRQKLLDNNYFIARGYCEKQCGGFNEETAKAKDKPMVLE
uniref:Putative serine proteinase inhibitor n=1 Tax=Amblyomma americanum TaxID=6943 RepID=A0A0C9RXB7_AMBAM